MNFINCTLCGQRIKITDEISASALREMEERFGDIPPEDRMIVCNECDQWVQDVERIAREMCIQNNLDPDIIITKMDTNFQPDQVPTWVSFIEEARKMTKLSPPEARSIIATWDSGGSSVH